MFLDSKLNDAVTEKCSTWRDLRACQCQKSLSKAKLSFSILQQTMEASMINDFITNSKKASMLWILGFREACSIHRGFILCLRSRQLLKRTGQCFLLNGFIFLGSMFILNSVIIPALHWILPDDCSLHFNSHQICSFHRLFLFYSFLRGQLIQLFNVMWFYPLYLFSFVLSNLWYNDIGEYGFAAAEKSGSGEVDPSMQNANRAGRPAGLGGVVIGIGEQVYSLLLLNVFFLEVMVTGIVPYLGKPLNFLLLSWIYAYYCFEYKWTLSKVDLDQRLSFFESNWAFFAGFGSPCVLPLLFCSPLVAYGIMAILFPLFVLTATDSESEKVISSQKAKWGDSELGRLPIFYAANTLSMRVLSLLHFESEETSKDTKAQ